MDGPAPHATTGSHPATSGLDPERARLTGPEADADAWRRWGPYLSERAWGSVREDHSPHGTAWKALPHDHARSRACRWNEDGLAGLCDDQQQLRVACAFHNSRDPILKERLFGLTGDEGNHDATPTHSWSCWQYADPPAAFPHDDLVLSNGALSREEPEYELLDTGGVRPRPLGHRGRPREGRPRRPRDGARRRRGGAPAPAQHRPGAEPTVVAGYPWFGDWPRDTMISYEGLFLSTGRTDEGRHLLERGAAELSQGMLAVTADNDLAASLLPAFGGIVDHQLAGTRFGIGVDAADGLLTQGGAGVALTWMDARIAGVPVTPRHGKPIEVNALWVNALTATALLPELLGQDATDIHALAARASEGVRRRFMAGGSLLDVVDRPDGDDSALRPYPLLAISLPHAPIIDREVVARHLGDWEVGSVSKTAGGDPPHHATGTPFQSWSVAELLRREGPR